jgi:DNA-binding transcriptional ArsR family regulator
MRANVILKNQTAVAISEELCDVPCFKEALVKRLRSKMPSEEAIEEARILFGALADCARVKILYSLKHADELCVCDVAHVLGTSVSTASHHLRKLRDLKLLKYRNDGKMSYYSLKNDFAVQLVMDVLDSAKR